MKSLSFFRYSRPPSENAEVTDIDVTPVMNMFIILIPFLVSMAVFTHVSIIDFSLPPNVGADLDSSQGKPKLKLTVVVAESYLAITQGEAMLDSIPAIEGNYDFRTLGESLAGYRAGAEIKDETVVSIGDRVKFKYAVKAMDACRDAGYEKIGLSSAGMSTIARGTGL